MNSLDVATKVALLDAVTDVAADDEVRCVVLTGSGRAFCVGQDLKEHVGLLENGGSDALFTTVPDHYNPIVTAIATMPKPVIAAVNGVAAGAGASLAFACDLRILSETAGFNLAFTGHRALLRHRVVVDPAPPGRPGEGARAALRAADHRRRRSPWCWGSRRASSPPEELADEVAAYASRLAAGPDRGVRRDPPLGDLLRHATTSRSRSPSRPR